MGTVNYIISIGRFKVCSSSNLLRQPSLTSVYVCCLNEEQVRKLAASIGLESSNRQVVCVRNPDSGKWLYIIRSEADASPLMQDLAAVAAASALSAAVATLIIDWIVQLLPTSSLFLRFNLKQQQQLVWLFNVVITLALALNWNDQNEIKATNTNEKSLKELNSIIQFAIKSSSIAPPMRIKIFLFTSIGLRVLLAHFHVQLQTSI